MKPKKIPRIAIKARLAVNKCGLPHRVLVVEAATDPVDVSAVSGLW